MEFLICLNKMEKIVEFGQQKIPLQHIFINRKHVFGFVNLLPVTQGHVLISTKRKVSKFTQLDENETLELTWTAQEVSTMLSNVYNCEVS